MFVFFFSIAIPAGAEPHNEEKNVKPMVIPALQEWDGGSGDYRLSSRTRIVYSAKSSRALRQVSRTFAKDLAALKNWEPRVVAGHIGDLRSGDIFLSLGSADAQLGREGYTLSIGDHIVITARTAAGSFYGTRTILQLVRQSAFVPQGTARDWPDAPERGLMLDVGRKYFTPDWIASQIQEMAYLKLNYLHLHLSDNQGFRIESTRHPEYVSDLHLSKRQVARLIALAARYNIVVVPEIDMPGHMEAILGQHPELRLTDRSGVPYATQIDISNPDSYRLVRDILEEYLPLFPGRYFHIGADEYGTSPTLFPQLQHFARTHYGPAANGKDAFFGFINWANRIIRAAGKTMRIWNDGLRGNGSVLDVDTTVIVEYWYNHGPISPQQHIDKGHQISNESWVPTYYILGGNKPDSAWGYEKWNRHLFQGNQGLKSVSRSMNLGSKIHVWCDIPNLETETEIAVGIIGPLRMLAQQTWGSPKPFATWADYQSVIRRAGHNPDWPFRPQKTQ